MEDALQQYIDSRKKLSDYFEADIWHNVIINIEDKWTDYGQQHGEIAWDFDSEWMYSFETYGTSKWISKDEKYTLFVGDDGCGNRDCYIFLNELKVDDE